MFYGSSLCHCFMEVVYPLFMVDSHLFGFIMVFHMRYFMEVVSQQYMIC